MFKLYWKVFTAVVLSPVAIVSRSLGAILGTIYWTFIRGFRFPLDS